MKPKDGIGIEPVDTIEKQYVIYHLVTKVVRGVSTELIDVEKTEGIVEVDYKVDLSGGWKKLGDKNQLLDATPEEVKASGYDYEFNEQKKEETKQGLSVSIDNLLADPSVPETVKEYFRLLSQLQ